MDIMKQPLHPRVWAWLELAIEAGVDGQGPIFASASWSSHSSTLPQEVRHHRTIDDMPGSIVGGRQLHWEFIVLIKRWSTNLPRVAGQIQVGIMWIKKKERWWWWWWFWRVWVLRLRGSGSHSAPVLVPASAAIAQQPHSPWIGAERKEFYSSWHNVDKEKGKMMMMMILKIKIPGTPSPPRANDPRGRFSVIWDKTQRSSYCNSYE